MRPAAVEQTLKKMIGNITGIHIIVYKQNDNLLHCTKEKKPKKERRRSNKNK